MTKKITLAKGLNDLGGKVIVDGDDTLTLGRAIAYILSRTESKDPMRSYVLSLAFYKEDSIDLNASDLSFVIESIKTSGSKLYQPLVTGQVLQLLEEKDEGSKSDQ